jgi:hypothetical protein
LGSFCIKTKHINDSTKFTLSYQEFLISKFDVRRSFGHSERSEESHFGFYSVVLHFALYTLHFLRIQHRVSSLLSLGPAAATVERLVPNKRAIRYGSAAARKEHPFGRLRAFRLIILYCYLMIG